MEKMKKMFARMIERFMPEYLHFYYDVRTKTWDLCDFRGFCALYWSSPTLAGLRHARAFTEDDLYWGEEI